VIIIIRSKNNTGMAFYHPKNKTNKKEGEKRERKEAQQLQTDKQTRKITSKIKPII